MPYDLRCWFADADRSCPPRTSGFRCFADPARTTHGAAGEVERGLDVAAMVTSSGYRCSRWARLEERRMRSIVMATAAITPGPI